MLGGSQAIVTKNRVYLLGGIDGDAFITNIYTAPINEDGTLGAWTTGTSLPGILAFSQAIVTKNRVYLLGGYSAVSFAIVYTAPFADGWEILLSDYYIPGMVIDLYGNVTGSSTLQAIEPGKTISNEVFI